MNRRTLLVCGLALVASSGAVAADAPPSADQVLANVDKNMTFDSRSSHTTMTVVDGDRTRVEEMDSWAKGDDKAAIEYLAPARDKGQRLLRVGDDLWMYQPSVEKVLKISGHMMREGLSGSDVSYEDMVDASKLNDQYSAVMTGTETVDGKECYKLELTAKDPSITYQKRVSWVDPQTWIPVKQELYAVSGMLLKTWTMSDVQTFPDGRQFPTKMTVKDEVKKTSSTTIQMTNLAFGVPIDDSRFNQSWLERHD